MRFLALPAVALAFAAAAPLAVADDGDEVRARGTCTGGARAELRLRGEDGRIRVEFRVERSRARTWSVIVLHERRLVARTTVRSSGGLDFRRTIADWYGTDAVAVRATAPDGVSCRASATL